MPACEGRLTLCVARARLWAAALAVPSHTHQAQPTPIVNSHVGGGGPLHAVAAEDVDSDQDVQFDQDMSS